MKTQRGYTITEVAYISMLILIGVGVFGWGWNIVKVAHTCCAVIDGMLIVRIIGIFIAPLGAILGFF